MAKRTRLVIDISPELASALTQAVAADTLKLGRRVTLREFILQRLQIATKLENKPLTEEIFKDLGISGYTRETKT